MAEWEASLNAQFRRREPVIARGSEPAAHDRFARERERMVDEQVAARGVTDARVLAAMRRVPRHRFVDEALRDRAYGDHPLPDRRRADDLAALHRRRG